MKKLLLPLLFVTTLNFFSQSFNLKGNIKNILGENIENVNITTTSASEVSYVSDKKGNYKIPVKKGDTVNFSHISYATSTYLVTNSRRANIILGDSDIQVSEVTIKTKKKRRKTRYKVGLTRMDINSSNYFYGDRIMLGYFSITQMLKGRVILRGNGVLWDFDGTILSEPPGILSDEIMSIAVLRSPAETVVYGPRAFNRTVIVVRTYPDEYMRDLMDNKSLENPITNDNFYLNDAIPYTSVKRSFKYVNDYQSTENEKDIKKTYIESKKKYSENKDFYKENILFLKENYFPKSLIAKAIEDYYNTLKNNADELKFIAFNYSLLNQSEKAIETYKKIALEDLNSPESYRNLAFAYIQNEDYINAWKVYKYFLIKGNEIDDSNLGKIINAEMLFTYQKLKENKAIREKFKFNEFSSIIESDVRVVFEWDNEDNINFELVNPKKQSYVYKPNDNETSNFKDFYITDINENGWLINVLASNNNNKPTILKSTIYHNWGKPNQTQKSKIFYLDKKNLKYNLYNF